MLNILVIGSGGREHAIAKKFLSSLVVENVYVAPGNAGMARDGIQILPIAENDHEALINFAKEKAISWTFVGPEGPLLAGIADDFKKAGLKIFAPTKKAALIEGSKDFAKKIMQKKGIPTAKSRTFTDFASAKAFVEKKGAPIVIKADGLAAGKGVVVAEDVFTAIRALSEMMEAKSFGVSGTKVVIEEFLTGEEFSLLSFVREKEVFPMIIAQDHKRAFDGDRGPNTGGMGAIAPVPQISEKIVTTAIETIVKPMAIALAEDKRPFTGILYAGLISTTAGPKVIEFNARFGDPETQVVLPRLTSDFAQIIDDLLNNRTPNITWQDDGFTLGVVVATKGYPGNYPKGIKLPEMIQDAKIETYFAGVALNNEKNLISNGGRVYLISTTADTVEDAQKKLYDALDQENMTGFFYRHDIGSKAKNVKKCKA